MVTKPSPDPMASMWAWIAHDVRLYRMRASMTGADLGRVLKCVRYEHVGLDGAFEILYNERGDVAYAEAQLGGRLVISDAEVRGMAIRYDQIGARAWPEDPSREYIQQQMEAMP